jgi:biotin carboxyl carrier protein
VAAVSVYWFAWGTPGAEADEVITQTATACLQTLDKSVSASGTITQAVNETVSFEAAGTVLSVDVAEGDLVTEGQTLAMIDTLRLDAARLEAQATLAQAEASLARAEDGEDGTTASDARIAAAEAQVDVAAANLETAEANIADPELVAPAAGQITAVGVPVAVKTAGADPDAVEPARRYYQDTGASLYVAADAANRRYVLTGRTDFYVSASGDDAGPGTEDSPFATAQHAFDVAWPWTRGGVGVGGERLVDGAGPDRPAKIAAACSTQARADPAAPRKVAIRIDSMTRVIPGPMCSATTQPTRWARRNRTIRAWCDPCASAP